MSRTAFSATGRLSAGIALLAGLFMLLGMAVFAPASRAAADPTVWLCKPGENPNPCAGSLDGRLNAAGGPIPGPLLGYKAERDPKVDCFYAFPTQSAQTTPNADFAKDPELLVPTINQAAQFSRHCRVFAPVYRQYTNWALAHPEVITDQVRDLAYNDLKNAWEDYLSSYNKGRGVIVISHSQGTMHMARLLQKEVDNRPDVRRKIIGAYLIGGNVFVAKGQKVGGQFQHIPACSTGSETGCVVAYSSFQNQPDADAPFGRVDVGYWIHPDPRPDPGRFEVMCVNPAGFNGDGGKLRALANLGAFMNPNPAQIGTPWNEYDGFFQAECRNENGASWLQVEPVPGAGSPNPDLVDLVGRANGDNSKGDIHVGDVNLALDNLVALAGTQSEAWLKNDAQRSKLLNQQAKLKKSLKQQQRKSAKARKQCRKAKAGSKAKRANCRKARQLNSQVKKTRKQLARIQGQLKKLG